MRIQKYLVLSIFIILLIGFTSVAYSQTNDLICAVIEFKNSTENPDFDYLKYSFQNSIIESLSSVKGAKVIDATLANKVANSNGLSYDEHDNKRLILTYAAEAGVNIIVLGEFNIIKDDVITVKILHYSVAQLKIVDEFTLTGSVEDSFKLVNRIAITSSDKFIEKQEELQITLNQIREQVRPPKYKQKPEIVDISIDGIRIEWVTDKETISELYIGNRNNFGIDESFDTYLDKSTDAVNHYVIMDYENINIKEEYYLRSKEEDFFDNVIISDTIKIEKGIIYQDLLNDFEELKIDFTKKASHNINEEYDIDVATQIIVEFLDNTKKYNKLLDLDNHIAEQKDIYKIMNLLKEADVKINNKDFISSRDIYYKCMNILDGLVIYTDIISEKFLSRMVERVDVAMKVNKLIDEGDRSVQLENYRLARTQYSTVLKLVTKYKIEDLIELDYVKGKLDSIPKTLYYFYINTALGSGYNLLSNIDISETSITSWYLNFNIRSNRLMSYGFGIDLFSIEAFAKISPINTNGLFFNSSEFYIKGGISVDFLTEIISSVNTGIGIGANLATGYIWSFENYGISAEIKLWTVYFTGKSNNLPFNVSFNLGIVYNFGEFISG